MVSVLPWRGGTTGASFLAGWSFLSWPAARPATSTASRNVSVRMGGSRFEGGNGNNSLLRRGLPREHGVEQLVRQLAHLRWEVVATVGVLDPQAVRVAVELEHGPGGRRDPVHAVGPEVTV